MRLIFTDHADYRARQRGVPVLRKLPPSAKIAQIRVCNHDNFQDTLVTEYVFLYRREYRVARNRRGFEHDSGKITRRMCKCVYVVSAAGEEGHALVITAFWRESENIACAISSEQRAHRQSLLQKYREREEMEVSGEVWDDGDVWDDGEDDE